jgi:hypothetical protein
MLGDVVTELARRAAQAGATVLHSIRLLSVVPFEGAQVTGVAAACSDRGVGPFNATLVRAFYEAKAARSFFFPQSGSFGPIRSVENTEKVPGKELAGDAFDKLRTLTLSSVNYDDLRVRKSCPFEPSIGFQFLGSDIEVWWLVSHFCETGMLVFKTDDWRKSPLVNLRPEALRNFEQITENESGPGIKK